ncbi:MAG TPA: fibronectin type III domain-containing protein [Candidatus Dormibacteraeota bacterium]|nr:fibronectin type III domain-containing protein [Candidatus Dormibacteraeota bacterium]
MDEAEIVRAAPGAPRQVAVIAADSAAVVTWERPDDGPPVTRYEVTPVHGCTPLPQLTVSVDGASRSALVRCLSNGIVYSAQVTAWHGDRPSPTVTSVPFEPQPAPGAPTGVTAVGGERSATVQWAAATGGGPVERYRVVTTPADVADREVPAGQTSVLVVGLHNRSRYTFSVAAGNGAGENVSLPSNPVWPGDDVPWYLFPLELGYLLVLGALAYGYAVDRAVAAGPVTLPVLRDAIPPVVAGVPISVPWFGALGAVLIGLYGIFDHSHRDWQRALNKWHIARPFTGAVLGTVGFILFTAVIRATGVSPGAQDTLGKLVYFAIAFVVGFREETFRQLIKRVADLIVGPGQQWVSAKAPAPASRPAEAPAPAAPAPAPAPVPVAAVSAESR